MDRLPENYREIYAAHRMEKISRYAHYLEAIGFDDTAEHLRNSELVRGETEFNVTRAWTEYLNRVIGVIVGLMIMALFARSIYLWKSKPSVTVVAFITLVLVAVQGWLGSVVVATNLTPWTITLHMALALAIVALLATIVEMAGTRRTQNIPTQHVVLLGLAGAFLCLQIFFGTVVREGVDGVAMTMPDRSRWLSELGAMFTRHRSFSWAVLLTHLALVIQLWRKQMLDRRIITSALLVVVSMITGALMARFSVPATLQPVHLLLATLAFGLDFMVLLHWMAKSESQPA